MSTKRVAVVLLAVTAAGCQPAKEPSPTTAPAAAAVQIPNVPSREVFERQIAALDKRIRALEFDKTMREVQDMNTASFDPQDAKNYTPLKSPAGPVLIVLEHVEPYLDGFKVSFRLGNPTSATLSGVKGKIFWGPQLDPSKSAAELRQQSKEFEDATVFGPGSWTNLKINIGPATAAQARQISIQPVFNQISLRRPTG